MAGSRETKVILCYSPLSQSGQTTIATYVGLELASRGKFVLYLEMNRYSGSSPYLHKKLNTFKKRLKNVLERPDLLKDNIEKSKHNDNFFYICQPINSDLNELTSYNPINIDLLLKNAFGTFDYIIIDLDSSILDPATIRVFSKNFKVKIDYRLTVLTEDIKSTKMFTNTNTMFLDVGKEGSYQQKTLVAINKSHFRYSSFMENYFISQPGVDITNVIDVIDFPELKYYNNQGDLYRLGKSSMAKEFLDSITMITNCIQHDIFGIGINYKKKVSIIEKKLKQAKISKEKQDEKERKLLESNKVNIYVEDEIKKSKKSKKIKKRMSKEEKQNLKSINANVILDEDIVNDNVPVKETKKKGFSLFGNKNKEPKQPKKQKQSKQLKKQKPPKEKKSFFKKKQNKE